MAFYVLSLLYFFIYKYYLFDYKMITYLQVQKATLLKCTYVDIHLLNEIDQDKY